MVQDLLPKTRVKLSHEITVKHKLMRKWDLLWINTSIEKSVHSVKQCESGEPDHERLPSPRRPARWWFIIDSTFWNHSSFGAALW